MNCRNKLAFDTGDIPKNIDLNSPPVSGPDNLNRGRSETEKCPEVVVSNIDSAKFAHRQNVQIDDCNGFIPAPPGFKPNLEWQKQELKIFQSYRSKLEDSREMLKAKFPKRDYPNISNKGDWCLFCLGPEKHDEIYSLSETSDNDKIVPKHKKSRLEQKSTPPLLSIMLHLSRDSIIKLISYHIEWLETLNFTHEQGAWLYALLLKLETPLEPDTCSLLRSLSRVCSRLRADLSDSQEETLNALNIFISVIAVLFEQKDMSDEFSREGMPNDENESQMDFCKV